VSGDLTCLKITPEGGRQREREREREKGGRGVKVEEHDED